MTLHAARFYDRLLKTGGVKLQFRIVCTVGKILDKHFVKKVLFTDHVVAFLHTLWI